MPSRERPRHQCSWRVSMSIGRPGSGRGSCIQYSCRGPVAARQHAVHAAPVHLFMSCWPVSLRVISALCAARALRRPGRCVQDVYKVCTRRVQDKTCTRCVQHKTCTRQDVSPRSQARTLCVAPEPPSACDSARGVSAAGPGLAV
jgi:hypothetical protein